jgi:hypothetical protein
VTNVANHLWSTGKTVIERRPDRIASPSLCRLVVAVVLTVGCSHKEAYVAAKGLYAADLDDIASYASLLDAKLLGDADTRVVVPRVQNLAMRHICKIAQKQRLRTGQDDVDRQILSAFGGLQDGCCDTETPASCTTAIAHETSILAKLDADATKAGRPGGSFTPDPKAAYSRVNVEAVRSAATPTPEEATLLTLWKDPSTTGRALRGACERARASDPRERAPTGDDDGSAIAMARAFDTDMRCIALVHYTTLERVDADLVGSKPEDDARLCKQLHHNPDVELPASLAAKHDEMVARRCH